MTIAIGPPADRAEAEAFIDILSDSLSFPPRSQVDGLSRFDLADLRLARRGGRVAGGLVLLPTGQYFGGERLSMVGVNAVAVAPEDRGSGVGGALMRHVIAELARPGGPALACLYPATQPLYRSVGFEQAGTHTLYRIPIDSLPSAGHELAVERLAPDTVVERVGPIYERYARRQNGFVERTPWFWRRHVDPLIGDPRITYAVREQDRLTGYVTLSRTWHRQLSHMRSDLHCREIIAETPAALRRIFTFLADERSFGESIEVTGPPAPAEHMLLLEPSAAVSMQMRWMLRIMDVGKALACRGYPRGLQASVQLAVEDDLVESNRGRFSLAVAGGGAKVGPGAGEPEVAIDIRGLASLYSGFVPAEDLAAIGMAAGPADALAAATAIFAGPAPWLPEIF